MNEGLESFPSLSCLNLVLLNFGFGGVSLYDGVVTAAVRVVDRDVVISCCDGMWLLGCCHGIWCCAVVFGLL